MVHSVGAEPGGGHVLRGRFIKWLDYDPVNTNLMMQIGGCPPLFCTLLRPCNLWKTIKREICYISTWYSSTLTHSLLWVYIVVLSCSSQSFSPTPCTTHSETMALSSPPSPDDNCIIPGHRKRESFHFYLTQACSFTGSFQREARLIWIFECQWFQEIFMMPYPVQLCPTIIV